MIVQLVNDSEDLEDVFTKYNTYIGEMLFENKNYKELKQTDKTSSLFKVLSDIEFNSFDDLAENIKIQAALTVVNVCESYASIYDKLSDNNDIFELSMTDYNSLSDYYKSEAMKKMTSQNFKTVDELKTRFNTAVRDAKTEQNKASQGSSSQSGSGGGGGGTGTSAIVSGDIINALQQKDDEKNDNPEQTIPDNVSAFNDLDGVEWAKEAIEKLCEKNVVSGTGDGKFEPNREVTREEFVKCL